MKIIKRLLLVLVILLVLLVGAVFAIPYFFKDELVAATKEEINKTIKADVDFSDVSLSLFRSFPKLSFALQDLSVVGRDEFAGVPLVSAKEAGFSLDLMSVIRADGPVGVHSVELDQPAIHIIVLKNGTANYDITIPAEEVAPDTAATTDYSGLRIELESYSITDGKLIYDDRQSDTYVDLVGLNHQGEGDFTLDVYDLDTETTIQSLTVAQGGIAYLDEAELALDAIFNINMPESRYTLKENDLRINDLNLLADGNVQLLEEDINLDLSFSSPENDFRSLWSLIPNAYTADYADVAIDGEFRLEGLVKGTYNENSYPAFRLQTKVENGRVKYPDLPLGIERIHAFLDVNSPTSELNDMVISAPELGLKVGEDAFEARFTVKTPISDPDVDANVDGVIDLAQWARAFPVEGMEELSGRIIADVAVKTRLSTIEREAYEDVNMSGEMKIEQLKYHSTGLPPVVINDAAMTFTPQRVVVNDFAAELGESDVQASGQIDNILAYISPEKTMTGRMTAHSNYFLVDEWMPEEESTTAMANTGTAPAGIDEIFDRFDFELAATADRIVYDTYELTGSSVQGRVRPNRMEVSSLSTNIGDSDLRGSGTILNAFDYSFDDGVLGGNLAVQSNFLDLNQFMEEPAEGNTGTASGAEEAYGVIPVPANIDLTIDADLKQVRYTNMDLRDIRGKVMIQDESVVIEDGTTKLLGGQMAFSGAYDTKDVEKPGYRFMYDMSSIDFQEAFSALNTFKALAPIGRYIQGNFASNLIMEGTLGQDLMPNLSDINAEGLFQTVNSSLASYKPLQAIGNALDIQELRSEVELDNIKSWFTITNGTVEVKPFDVELADLPMTIAGTHGLDQQMNYTINTAIPRSMLGNNALGSTVNQGIDALVSQAGKLGLNINNAEVINVQIGLTGSLTDPKVTFKLLGTDGEVSLAQAAEDEARAFVDDQVDEVKGQVQEQVNEVREQVTNQAQEALDSAKNAAALAAQRAREQAAQQLRDQAAALIDSTKLNTDSLLQGQGQETIDKIEDKLRNFNPFKKRNGGGGN